MAAVVVARRQLHRDECHPELFIHADLSPHAGIAGVVGGVAVPGVVPKLARFRDRVEYPEALASPHIESADEAFHVGLALGYAAGPVRGADNHGIAGDNRRGVQSDFSGNQVDLLIVLKL